VNGKDEREKMKFEPGNVLPTTVMEAVSGKAINLPDPRILLYRRHPHAFLLLKASI
jgi:hypothetical protein